MIPRDKYKLKTHLVRAMELLNDGMSKQQVAQEMNLPVNAIHLFVRNKTYKQAYEYYLQSKN